MGTWKTAPAILPNPLEVCLIRPNYWFGQPFLAIWYSSIQSWKSIENRILFPAHSIVRWQSMTVAGLYPLVLTFDDMANSFVANPAVVSQWNAFFNLPLYGSAFNSCMVIQNSVLLYNSGTIKIPINLINNAANKTHFLSIIDKTIVATGDIAALKGSFIHTAVLPALSICYSSFMENCSRLTTIYIPICAPIGGSARDNLVFRGITGNVITLTIKATQSADGDVNWIKANNSVTVILV